MKFFAIISLLLSYCCALAQDSPEELSAQLTKNCKTDKQKVSAIFSWITENISYKIRPFQKMPVIGNSHLRWARDYQTVLPDTAALQPLNERVSREVLWSRQAVCDGYAKLFMTLCSYAGIKSEIIVGYAKSNQNKPTAKFGVNHYWNAVFFDNDWHLLDVTWASGYIDPKKKDFVKELDENYFLSDPAKFINDHYPDDLRWTLLPDTKIPDEFKYSPFRQRSFNKYNITAYYPSAGVINALEGDTILIELQLNLSKDRKISPSELTDSTLFSYSDSWVFLRPVKTDQKENGGQRCVYYFPVKSTQINWLFLVYNDDLILRYRVNITGRSVASLTASL